MYTPPPNRAATRPGRYKPPASLNAGAGTQEYGGERRGRRSDAEDAEKIPKMGLGLGEGFAALLPPYPHSRVELAIKTPPFLIPLLWRGTPQAGVVRRWCKQSLRQWAEHHPVRLRLPPLHRGEFLCLNAGAGRRGRRDCAEVAEKIPKMGLGLVEGFALLLPPCPHSRVELAN